MIFESIVLQAMIERINPFLDKGWLKLSQFQLAVGAVNIECCNLNPKGNTRYFVPDMWREFMDGLRRQPPDPQMIYVVRVCVSVSPNVSHAQIWTVRLDEKGKFVVSLLDPNGKSYSICDSHTNQQTYINNDTAKFVDLNNEELPKEYRPALRPAVIRSACIPCTYEHYRCWLVCICVLAKAVLNCADYTSLGFPSTIISKESLNQALHACLGKTLFVSSSTPHKIRVGIRSIADSKTV